jgi:HPt (histidine-containing phosphotransfer) domain-containing protein
VKDKKHLKNCQCLEQEAKEDYLLVNDNLERYQTQLKECQCEVSPKVRVDSDDYA